MLEFLKQYWLFTLIAIFVLIVIPALLAWKKRWSLLKTYAYTIIHQVEREILGTKQGQARMDKAITLIYKNYLPSWARIFIPKSLIKSIIQRSFDEISHILNDKPPEKK